jgi:integrase
LAHRYRGGTTPQGEGAHALALGAPRKSEGLCTLGHETPCVALSTSGLRCRASGICRATIRIAIRAPCRKDGTMKRAARHKIGSVVFDKRRRTWNFLWWEGKKRRSRLIGSTNEHPTKASAWRAAIAFQDSRQDQTKVVSNEPTVNMLVQQYRAEKMPKRSDTRRSYEVWLRNHIVPRWGDCSLTELQARPVELWLQSLPLAPKSKAHVRGLLSILWDFAVWRGDMPMQRNPMELVTVRGATKRKRQPRSLTVEEFHRFIHHLAGF